MEVSVIVIAYNEEDCIGQCLAAVLRQEFKDFELIIVDDGSTDGTKEAVSKISDPRIRYIHLAGNRGLAVARNAGVSQARGKYIFFTDADCVPSRYWLGMGLGILKQGGCLGVEGRSFYAGQSMGLSDIPFEALESGHFSTSNIAFIKEALDKAGLFNPRYSRNHEDQDLALRVKQQGRISFCPDMVVIHRREQFTVKKLFRYAARARDTVRFIKDHPQDYRQTLYWKNLMRFRVMYPGKLMIMFFPFLLIPCFNFNCWQDIKLIPFVYAAAVYARMIIWREAVKERIFLV